MIIQTILQWLTEHQYLLGWIGVISLLVFSLSLLSLPWLVAMIPEDYFLSQKRKRTFLKNEVFGTWIIIFILKNSIGLLLVIGGLLMLFLPGQGVLTIIAGLIMTDYPGKFELERRIVSNKKILEKLNWLRNKANQPSLRIDD
jgi:archaellum biogenesis protein FlaJ (TadC family)